MTGRRLSWLRRALDAPGLSPAVLTASLSRTLRRLWRSGRVELVDGKGRLFPRGAALGRRRVAIVRLPRHG